ncbi:Major Facilitator-like protein 2 [Dinothrombium tinctorium]|uniref:Major Facilitator-like protein 2 n=2 Tax=Dinothrombium tinctorium TaxID=1965070 RepID=A0A3S3QV65_9ACAR|nr:Major Facilitator-like protein 2 [Dinothrombium tinctorium]RWS14475.1 Major Facilitator-like protein 2 [Dinothrombium tinctorium]
MIAFTFSLLPKDKVSEHSASESKEVLTFKKNGTVCGRNLAELSPVTLEKFTPFSSSFRKALHSNYNSEKSSRFTSSRNSVDLSEKELPLRYSLYTLPYLLHQWWYSWLITYMIMYVGSMNLWLKRITTDNKTAASFIQIYGTVQVLSLVIAPIAGLIMDREVNKADDELDPKVRKLKKIKSGFWPMMFTTTCVTAILFARFFDNKAAVYASIVLITLFRSFLIAVSSAFLRIRFPAEHFNRLLGILSTVGACVTLLQFPLFVWEAKAAENVLWVNLFNLICTLIAYLNPLHLVIKPLQEYLIAKESKTNE